ncbi:MAG: UDP-N-acetylmuramate--L-alanine ligase [Actinobacteria bacterium]|nr:UDP-N-acetylmuramate--L-alanine ligase [Actinomycetota bacterium]
MEKNSAKYNLKKISSFYLIGIGGAGMSAIALVLKGMGFSVSGSDIKYSRYVSLLENEGIRVHIGHDGNHIIGFEAVIYSAAISENNVELLAAKEARLQIFSRGDVLAWILNNKNSIAVSGTHGKTTTTSMISLIFRGLGLDPTIIIGGELNELGSNARYGSGEYVIAEACESDGTFLNYKPLVGVITNIEEDHMDYYKNFDHLKESFYRFIGNIRKEGLIVIYGDEISPQEISRITPGKIISYGLKQDNDIYAENINLINFTCSYDLVIKENKNSGIGGVLKFKVKLNVPGIHNIKNSLAAISVCHGLKLDIEKSINILEFFTGTKRRFEKRGEKRGALIFDDYAHHPTEVKATLDAAFSEKKERIITVFQPHRYTRLSKFHDKFNTCFNNTDILIITDVFGSDEIPIPGVTGKLLIDSLLEEGFSKKLVYIPKLGDVKDYLNENIKEDDIVLLMGAGDITSVTDELLRN